MHVRTHICTFQCSTGPKLVGHPCHTPLHHIIDLDPLHCMTSPDIDPHITSPDIDPSHSHHQDIDPSHHLTLTPHITSPDIDPSHHITSPRHEPLTLDVYQVTLESSVHTDVPISLLSYLAVKVDISFPLTWDPSFPLT